MNKSGKKKKVGKWEERSEREGPRGTNDDRTVPATSSYTCLRARAERRNGRTWRREREGGGGACSAAKPTSKIKLIRLSFSSSFCFSCDFFKKLFLLKLKRACVRSPLTNAPTPIPIPSKEHLLLLLLLLLVFWLILLSGLGLLTPSVVRQFSSRLGFWSFCHLGDGSKEIWQRRASYTPPSFCPPKFFNSRNLLQETFLGRIKFCAILTCFHANFFSRKEKKKDGWDF